MKKKLEIKKINIDLIRPYWRNPRKNDETVKSGRKPASVVIEDK